MRKLSEFCVCASFEKLEEYPAILQKESIPWKGTDLGKKCGEQGSFFTPRMCAYIRHQVPVLWEGRKSVSVGILEEVTLKYNLENSFLG